MNAKILFNRAVLKLKKHSPEIMVVTGVVTGAVGLVVACKETLKVKSIIDEAKETFEKIEEMKPVVNEETGEEEIHHYEDTDGEIKEYTEKVAKKDKTVCAIKTGVKVAKNYIPAAVLCITSVTLILCGFGILKKRHIALSAAYAGIAESYKQYRNRIIDKYGKEVDTETLLGLTKKIIAEETVDEKGNVTAEEKEEIKAEADLFDDRDYKIIFSKETAPLTWQNNYLCNQTFIKTTMKHAQYLLDTKGYVFLNDIYDALGMPRTRTGALVGWMLDDDGDNFIDCGMRCANDNVWTEPNVLLEFNCQGPIYDKFERYERKNYDAKRKSRWGR